MVKEIKFKHIYDQSYRKFKEKRLAYLRNEFYLCHVLLQVWFLSKCFQDKVVFNAVIFQIKSLITNDMISNTSYIVLDILKMNITKRFLTNKHHQLSKIHLVIEPIQPMTDGIFLISAEVKQSNFQKRFLEPNIKNMAMTKVLSVIV